MAIELWLRAVDKELFERTCNGKKLEEERVKLSPYMDSDILTGELTGNNIGKLSALGKEFVLGRKGKKNYEVTILNNSTYGKVSMTTTLGRGILIMGDPDKEDFIKRVFGSYHYGQHVDKRTEKDHHFILYHSVNP